jgi:hypothetical protein
VLYRGSRGRLDGVLKTAHGLVERQDLTAQRDGRI